MRILIKYACKAQRHVIINSLNASKDTIISVIKKLIRYVPFTSFENDKLGGPQKIVQIDETMLNYKCKSHRGRSPKNQTDALCIVKFTDKITRRSHALFRIKNL